jgi:hypothetical protein
MQRSAKRIPPRKLVDAFLDAGGKSTVAVQDALWEDFGPKTIDTMTDGARVLARIWEGAWKKGNGNAIPTNELGMIEPDLLKTHYENLKFVESVDLDHIEPFLE